jgi:hypothetical protein
MGCLVEAKVAMDHVTAGQRAAAAQDGQAGAGSEL